ncbi:MAG: EAL domain-containing protein [Clostridia bacterium]
MLHYFQTTLNTLNLFLHETISHTIDFVHFDFRLNFLFGMTAPDAEKVLSSVLIAISVVSALLIVFIAISFINNRIMRRSYYFDQLTGLYSEAGFDQLLKKRFKQYSNNDFYVVDFDINNFEHFNYAFGYEVGNRLIIRLANLIRDYLTDCEFATRISGDHFVMCFIRKDNDTRNLYTGLKSANEQLKLFSIDYSIVPSFGIYKVDDKTLPPSVIRDRALIAKKTVKGKRDTLYGVYNPEYHKNQLEENQLTSEIEYALLNKEFIPYFQPQVDTKTEQVVGVELLARWKKPDGTIIPPSKFINALEKSGLITQLDFLMCEEACKILSANILKISPEESRPISVNFSKLNLYKNNFVESILALTQKYNVSPRLIGIEFTEQIFVLEQLKIENCLYKLHAAGFTVSLDDFGSGYSSLNMIRNFPFDYVKLDKAFFSAMLLGQKDRIVVESIVQMTKKLNIKTVAEGVETKEQLEFLRACGCDVIQGYYFSKPLNFADLLTFKEKIAGKKKPAMTFEEILLTHSSQLDLAQHDSVDFSDQLSKAVFKFVPIGLSIWDIKQNKLLDLNQATLDLLGYDEEELKSQSWFSLVHIDDKDLLKEFYTEFIITGGPTKKDLRFYHKDGRVIYVEFELVSFGMGNDNRPYTLALLKDVTNEVAQYNALKISEGRYRAIANDENSVIISIDTVNDIALFPENNSLGVSVVKNYIKNLHSRELTYTFVHPDYVDEWVSVIKECINTIGGKRGSIDCLAKLFQNEYRWCRLSYIPICDQRGNVIEIIGKGQNINKEKIAYLELAEQVSKDPLTKFYNRDVMMSMVSQVLSQTTSETSHACFMVDIDNLRESNAKYGHIRTDEIIKKFADILARSVRDEDLIARLGGDEFLIFAKNCKTADAKVIAQRILSLTERFTVTGIGLVKQGCSIGIALYRNDNIDYSGLVARADSAMYNAKQRGKNQFSFYSASMAFLEKFDEGN